jgi:hypothetical protein
MPHECRAYQKNDNEMQSELFLQGSEVVKYWRSGVKDQMCTWCCLWKCIKVMNRERVCGLLFGSELQALGGTGTIEYAISPSVFLRRAREPGRAGECPESLDNGSTSQPIKTSLPDSLRSFLFHNSRPAKTSDSGAEGAVHGISKRTGVARAQPD